jgi:uncharacterized metal-binding protein YceD (DUF177 family)
MITFASPNLFIPLNGLASGRTVFDWKVGLTFFESFGNSEIIGADVSVEACVEKSGRSIDIDCQIRGSVTVACDRCLEDLVLPVDVTVPLSVHFGEEPASGEETGEGEREILCIPPGQPELDLGQVVYDYVCLAIPMQRVHPDGSCNPAALRYLSSPASEETAAGRENPFAALKGLLKNEQ